MEPKNHQRKPSAGHQLPQWNSKLSFSAQRHDAAAGEGATAKVNERKTPLGQPRRVPIGKDQAAALAVSEAQRADSRAHASSKSSSQVTPVDSDKTPIICLFQRFESLTISTPATGTTAVSKAPCAAGSAAVEQRAKPYRSVAFGTPSVLTYTPAEAPTAIQQQDTPLWSNAGHTPYSLEGPAAAVAIRECLTAEQLGGHNDGVCVEFFTSIITDTGAEQTPATTKSCPKTPGAAGGGAVALEALPVKTTAAGSAAQLIDFACAPGCVANNRGGVQREVGDCSISAVAPASQFTGFTTAKSGSSLSRAPGSTPLLISTRSTSTNEVVSNGTPNTPAPAAAVDGCGSSLHLPAQTPKSKLKQPARVPVAASRPAVPTELKQLLGTAPGVVTAADQAGKLPLGSCGILSPVRSKKQQQYTLGAEQQVLTPVRRSARKALKQHLDTDIVHVKPMLEATNYCYQPNEALQDFQHS